MFTLCVPTNQHVSVWVEAYTSNLMIYNVFYCFWSVHKVVSNTQTSIPYYQFIIVMYYIYCALCECMHYNGMSLRNLVSILDKPETCASTTSSVLSRHFQKKALPLVGGAPCFGNQGYCDKFHVCRLLDADGPIARLKNSFLHLDDFDDMGEWMKVVSCY